VEEESMHPGTVWLSKRLDRVIKKEIKKKKIQVHQLDNRRIGKRKKVMK